MKALNRLTAMTMNRLQYSAIFGEWASEGSFAYATAPRSSFASPLPRQGALPALNSSSCTGAKQAAVLLLVSALHRPAAHCRPHLAPPPPEYRKPLRLKAWQHGTEYRAKLHGERASLAQPRDAVMASRAA